LLSHQEHLIVVTVCLAKVFYQIIVNIKDSDKTNNLHVKVHIFLIMIDVILCCEATENLSTSIYSLNNHDKKQKICLILPHMYLAGKLTFRNISQFELFDPRSF
jgi:hypothetical protein